MQDEVDVHPAVRPAQRPDRVSAPRRPVGRAHALIVGEPADGDRAGALPAESGENTSIRWSGAPVSDIGATEGEAAERRGERRPSQQRHVEQAVRRGHRDARLAKQCMTPEAKRSIDDRICSRSATASMSRTKRARVRPRGRDREPRRGPAICTLQFRNRPKPAMAPPSRSLAFPAVHLSTASVPGVACIDAANPPYVTNY